MHSLHNQEDTDSSDQEESGDFNMFVNSVAESEKSMNDVSDPWIDGVSETWKQKGSL